MNPVIHMNPIPIIKRYSLRELSGTKLVNAIIKIIKQAIQITGAKIQKSFVIGINISLKSCFIDE
jgi:hypothetical protein